MKPNNCIVINLLIICLIINKYKIQVQYRYCQFQNAFKNTSWEQDNFLGEVRFMF